jgi:glucose/arabinose dehydrogenase
MGVIARIMLLLPLIMLGIAGCGEHATLPVSAGMGPNPKLPPPKSTLIPTVNVAKVVGWPAGVTPTPAAGLKVTQFADGLDHPRWLLVLPNGDVLVAETDAPPKPEDSKGIKGWVMKLLMKEAGTGTPSANRITLLRDKDGDGVADDRSVLLENLYSPFGMTLVGSDLYVADSDALMRFPYHQGDTKITAPGVKVVDLPAGPINHHWTKNVLADRDGKRLFVTVGSNSNVAENGIEAEEGRAAIWEVNPQTGEHRIFASGLRNPNGLGFEPETGVLWTAVNERDEIGSDLVPDFMTSVRDGGFYGWPYSYYGQHVDHRVMPQRPDLVKKAIKPDFALGSHVAALGLWFYSGNMLPQYKGGAFVAEHGSWDRSPLSGYQIVYVPFENGMPKGPVQPVVTGFHSADEKQLYGAPVGMAQDGEGALLFADDVGNVIWRVSSAR